MNRETIFQTSLLDIIFKDRNKDYGAYALRKFYNRRMYFAVCSMTAFSMIACLFILTINDPQKITVANIKKIFTPDHVITPLHSSSHTALKTVANVSHVKAIVKPQAPPKITTIININNLPATVPELPSSSLQIDGLNMNLQSSGYGDDYDKGDSKAAHVTVTEERPKDSHLPSKVDVMPEYPGGLDALMAFKREFTCTRKY